MKTSFQKAFAAVIAVLLIFCISGCKKDEKEPENLINPPVEKEDLPQITDPIDEGPRKRPGEPHFDLPESGVQQLVSFVSPFNTFPVEFDDPATLSDEVLFFTAAAALKTEFVPNSDGYTSTLPLSHVENKVSEYFGKGVKLSDEYRAKDFSPYVISGENVTQIDYAGSPGSFYFTFAAFDDGDRFELWLIDLMDPCFFDDENHQEELYTGVSIVWYDIKPVADEIMYNIYTIEKVGTGYRLISFRHENYKEFESITF